MNAVQNAKGAMSYESIGVPALSLQNPNGFLTCFLFFMIGMHRQAETVALCGPMGREDIFSLGDCNLRSMCFAKSI